MASIVSARTLAFGVLATCCPVLLLACWLRGLEALFVFLVPVVPVALCVVGAARLDGSIGRLGWGLAALLLYLEACFVGMWLGRGEVAGGPWVLGLPWPMTIQFYALFLLPVPLMASLYAATFSRYGFNDAELTDLRRRFGSAEEPLP
ncbi:MAG: hypothetical protein AAGN46_02300 [Acidobacteriota bacterium]